MPINPSRRSFLKTSLVSGSFLCTINVVSQGKEGAEEKRPQDIHAYLLIHPNNSIVMHSPIAEMGQYMRTTGPMMLAEEFDLPWEKIRFTEETPLHLTQDAEGTVSYRYADMDSGGSYAVKRNWEPMRQIGATLRQQFMQAASVLWSVPVEEIRTRNAYLYHDKSESRIAYAQVAELASNQKVDFQSSMFKDPSDYRILGTEKADVDLEKIVTGKPLYGFDAEYPGMLNCVILRAPILGASPVIKNRKHVVSMPGVKHLIEVPAMIDEHWLSGQTTVVPAGIAIVATKLWQAISAKRRLEVEWKQNPKFAGQNSEQQISNFHTLVNSDKAEVEQVRNDGNIDTAFSNAKTIMDLTFEKPLLAHAAMEPFSCIADASSEPPYLEVGHQFPKRAAEIAASILDVPATDIEFKGKRMGGGFGRRARKDFVWEAVWLSQQINAPLKVSWLREDDFEQDYFGPATVTRIRAALDDDHNLIAWHHRQAHTKGGSQFSSFPCGLVENYRVEHCKTESFIRAGAWRGPFHLQWAFPAESMIDELAHSAGQDPLAFRLKLLGKDRTLPFANWGAENIDTGRMAACYRACAEAAEWYKPRPDGVGIGIAGHFVHGSYAAFVLEVEVTDSNKLELKQAWGAIDCGMALNPDHIRNQMEGGFIEGLNAAMFNKIDVVNSEVQQKNFHNFHWMRLRQAPVSIETTIIKSDHQPSGVGEPPTAPAAAALANAIFAACGIRLTKMPFSGEFNL